MLCCSNVVCGSKDGCIFLSICFPCFSHPKLKFPLTPLGLKRLVSRAFSCPPGGGDSRILHCIVFSPTVFRSRSSTPSVTHGGSNCYAGSRDQVGVCQSQSRCFTLASRPAVFLPRPHTPPHPSVERLSVSLAHTRAHKQQAGQLGPLNSPTCSNANVIPPCKMALAGRFCFCAGRLSVTQQQLLVLGSR